jgi:hypothetical protein
MPNRRRQGVKRALEVVRVQVREQLLLAESVSLRQWAS